MQYKACSENFLNNSKVDAPKCLHILKYITSKDTIHNNNKHQNKSLHDDFFISALLENFMDMW